MKVTSSMAKLLALVVPATVKFSEIEVGPPKRDGGTRPNAAQVTVFSAKVVVSGTDT